MLEASSALTLPPGSNLRRKEDPAWIHLLPTPKARVLVDSEAPAELIGLLDQQSSSIETSDDAVEDLTRYDLIVRRKKRPRRIREARLDEATILATRVTRASIPPSGWFVSSYEPPTRIGRARDILAQVASARLHTMVRAHVPDRARRHASDLRRQRPYDVADRVTPGWHLAGAAFADNRPPAYLASLAAKHGFEIEPGSWSVSGPRGYPSQKVIFFVEGAHPFVIKTVQEPRFNHRLLAEARALTRIQEMGSSVAFKAPSLLFSDVQGDRVLLGESYAGGIPFRKVASPSVGDGALELGLHSLASLATATASSQGAGAAGAAVQQVVARHNQIFSPPPAVAAELRAACDRLDGASIPSVFQHGDPGVWNCLIDKSGDLVILDWENADPDGMPLWDLFVFARTFGVYSWEARAGRSGERARRGLFGTDQELRPAIEPVIRKLCSQLVIDPALATDLFLLCWVQQAVREASTRHNPRWGDAPSHDYVLGALEDPLVIHG